MVLPQPPHQSESVPDSATLCSGPCLHRPPCACSTTRPAVWGPLSICSLLLPVACLARLPLLQAISELIVLLCKHSASTGSCCRSTQGVTVQFQREQAKKMREFFRSQSSKQDAVKAQ